MDALGELFTAGYPVGSNPELPGQGGHMTRRSRCRRRSRSLAATALPLTAAAMVALAGCGGGQPPVPPAVAAPAVALPADAFTATVVRIVDGDTIIARTSAAGAKLRVRVVGIDTPESVKPGEGVACYGHQASSFTKELLPVGARIKAAYEVEHQDHYGRELWDIWLPDGRSLESVLAASGVARIDPFPPNIVHAEVLATASTQAQTAHRGLWGACGFAKAYPDLAKKGVGPGG